MKKERNIKSYTTGELKALSTRSRTNLEKVDSITDEQLERLIASDKDENGLKPDWTKAKLVLPRAKQSVHLRLEHEIIEYFKSQGKGHIARMQAVLKSYVNAHRLHVK